MKIRLPFPEKVVKQLFIGFFILGFSCFQLRAEILERTISIELKNMPFNEALRAISNVANFDYSYNAGFVDNTHLVSLSAKNQRVSEVINQALKGTELTYKETRGILIFYPAKKPKRVVTIQNTLSGVVTDTLGIILKNVDVYNQELGLYTTTDENGRFELDVESPSLNLKLHFSKKYYQVKKVNIKVNSEQLIKVSLVHEPLQKESFTEITPKKSDSTNINIAPPKLFVPEKVVAKQLDQDTLRTVIASAGLFPPASSKYLNAGTEINRFSFHLLADYGAGIEGFTFSGLASVYRFHSSGIAFAGLGNWAGGNMNGIQVAGLLNNNILYTNGFQASGLVNMTGVHMAGLQISGIGNVNRQHAYGLQISGLSNFTVGSSQGIQISGLFNRGGLMRGIQLSGILNSARRTQGLQASLVNHSGRLEGLQVGLFNVADSSKYGVQIGLINIIRHNGYRQIEVSYDDLTFINFAFRSGARYFHSLLSVGAAVRPEEPMYRLGYGIGSDIKVVGPMAFVLEAEAFHVTENPWVNDISVLARAKSGLAFYAAGVSFFGTFNYNVYYTNYLNESLDGPKIPLITNPFEEGKDGDEFYYQMSYGFSAGIRINI